MGAITISSCTDNAFSEENTRLIRTITNHISSTLARLQTSLVAEKTKMESMVESMSEGTIMTDVYDEVVIFNPRAREIVGVSTKGHIPAQELVNRMRALGLMGALEECKEKKEPVVQVITMSSLGQKMFIRCDVAPVKNPEGIVIGHVTILTDVTKEKELDNIKAEFVSTVSHELRTPLSITREGISLVLDKTVGDLNERQAHFLVAARNNIDRLTNIINDLLDIAKIDSGRMALNRESTDLSELIRQVVDSFQIRARRRGIEVKTNLPTKELIVRIDSEKMTQVFINIIGNSMKFTEKGHIEITLKDSDNKIECAVEDTGVGISLDDLKNLFGKFQQFNRVEGEEKGTGLGLSIAKGIIELHHGKIWGESELGRGTKFHFTLPKQ